MQTQLQRNPVYQQLNDLLRSTLASEYASGDRFMTEREIAKRFEVSRATANKALASLVSEGVLEFRRGIGTFVRRDVIDYDLQSLVSFTEKALSAGRKPSTKLIVFRSVASDDVDDEIRSAMNLKAGQPLWELERLRLADGIPVILEHRYVMKQHCEKLTRAQASGSLYKAWTQKHALKISGADEVIRAVVLKSREAKHLQVASRTAALEVTAVGCLDDNSPLWWERTLYRSDQYEFHSRLGPIQTATPARGQLRGPANEGSK